MSLHAAPWAGALCDATQALLDLAAEIEGENPEGAEHLRADADTLTHMLERISIVTLDLPKLDRLGIRDRLEGLIDPRDAPHLDRQEAYR